MDQLRRLDGGGGVQDVAKHGQVVLTLRLPGQVHHGVGLLGQGRQLVRRPR